MATKAQLEAEVSRLKEQSGRQYAKIATLIREKDELQLKVEGAYDAERTGDSIRAAVREVFEEPIRDYGAPEMLDTEGLKAARARKLARPNAFRTTLLNTCAVLLHERDALAQAVKVKEAKVKELEDKIDDMYDKDTVREALEDNAKIVEDYLGYETADEDFRTFTLRRDLRVAVNEYA